MGHPTPITALRLATLVLPPLAVMAVIFYLSSQPSTAHYPTWEVVARKIGHVSGYALLTFAWWRAFRGLLPSGRPYVAVAAAVAVSVAYAISDELHQTLVTNRHGTPVDVLIDSIGIIVAAMLAMRLSRPAQKTGCSV